VDSINNKSCIIW